MSSNLLSYPPWGGGYKNEVIEKLVGDPLLLNIIFEANKKNKSDNSFIDFLNGALSPPPKNAEMNWVKRPKYSRDLGIQNFLVLIRLCCSKSLV